MSKKEKTPKIVKSYSLPPHQVSWLRGVAANETTADKTMSASAVLEKLINDAKNDCPHPVKMREERLVAISLSDKLASGEATTLRFFYCHKCRHNVLAEPDTELSEKLEKAGF